MPPASSLEQLQAVHSLRVLSSAGLMPRDMRVRLRVVRAYRSSCNRASPVGPRVVSVLRVAARGLRVSWTSVASSRTRSRR